MCISLLWVFRCDQQSSVYSLSLNDLYLWIILIRPIHLTFWRDNPPCFPLNLRLWLYKCLTPPAHNETNQISIQYPYNVYLLLCLVCNVQLKVQLIVFSTNKWVGVTRAGWCCVVCVVDYPVTSIRWVAFHKVVRRHCSGALASLVNRRVYHFLLLNFLRILFYTPKIIRKFRNLEDGKKCRR